VFGRKDTRSGLRGESSPEKVRLSLDDIGRYVIAGVRARGYPQDFHALAARRVRFLEARGLPGFIAFAREMATARHETLPQRAQVIRPDGSLGGQCPMIDSVRIGERMDEIVALPAGQAATLPMPTNPLLVVPKLADYAGPNGIIMMATFYVAGEPLTRVFVDGHRAASEGPLRGIFDADMLGISRFPEETNGVPPLRAAYLQAAEFPASMLQTFMNVIEAYQ
jgi:hypothetical protein